MATNGTNGHESLIKPAIGKAAARAHLAVDRAEKAANKAARRAERAVAPATDLVTQSCDYVSANPLKAVGAAVVVGMVLGRILL